MAHLTCDAGHVKEYNKPSEGGNVKYDGTRSCRALRRQLRQVTAARSGRVFAKLTAVDLRVHGANQFLG